MEKVIWIRSLAGYGKIDDGLNVVNKHLEEGWKVKNITACSVDSGKATCYAYVVIEKDK